MTSKEEVELLMNDGITFAEQMLALHAEFYPFGRTLTTDGRIQLVSPSDGTEHPSSQDLIDILLNGFRSEAGAGQHRAVALFMDVTVRDPTSGQKVDAVQVGLEHRDGYCADVFFPYAIANGAVSFGRMFAQQREGMVFGPSGLTRS
jgi:hypothetical protein